MSGTSRDGDDRARGNRHTVGKCERAQHETVKGNWEEVESGSVSRNLRGGIQRTDGKTIKPLGLPDEAVYLIHLVHPSFRPAFFLDHDIDLFPQGFQIFGIGNEAVQNLRGSLWAENDYEYVIDGDGTLAKAVVCTPAKLAMSNRRAKPSTDLSTPLASVMRPMSKSVCKSAM